MHPIEGHPFFCSWSGGKDSALALYRAVQQGGKPSALLTMMIENGRRSRSHGISVPVLQAQADAMGVPIFFHPTSWEDYERAFRARLGEIRELGIRDGFFGDIDHLHHREWVERVCAAEGISAHLPLWQNDREHLLSELIRLDFKAVVIAIKESALDKSLLGSALDESLIDRFRAENIDLAGEAGEYHTLVIDGPLFDRALSLARGATSLRDGYWFLDVSLENHAGETLCHELD